MIFNEAHILPKYVVHFTRNTPVPKAPTTSANTWGITEVVAWAATIGLSKDYGELFRTENITGTVLETMKSEEDWKQLGIPTFGDRRTLTIATKKLFGN